MHFGIDYGSKLAGTTVITYDDGKLLKQRSSQKNKDADRFIVDAIQELNPGRIFIDAPLSLPLAYFGKGDDFFYREADKQLKAMSPMFLGGLTARAMKLRSAIENRGIMVYETYPGALVRSQTELSEVYKKKAKKPGWELLERINALVQGYEMDCTVNNMHQVDSILAWHSGQRFQEGKAEMIGNREEGVIIF